MNESVVERRRCQGISRLLERWRLHEEWWAIAGDRGNRPLRTAAAVASADDGNGERLWRRGYER